MWVEKDCGILYVCDGEHSIEIGTIEDAKDLIETLSHIVKTVEDNQK
jgi:hypothetical protein